MRKIGSATIHEIRRIKVFSIKLQREGIGASLLSFHILKDGEKCESHFPPKSTIGSPKITALDEEIFRLSDLYWIKQ